MGCSCDGQLIASAGEDQKCVVASVADGSVVTALRVPKAAGEHGRTSSAHSGFYFCSCNAATSTRLQAGAAATNRIGVRCFVLGFRSCRFGADGKHLFTLSIKRVKNGRAVETRGGVLTKYVTRVCLAAQIPLEYPKSTPGRSVDRVRLVCREVGKRLAKWELGWLSVRTVDKGRRCSFDRQHRPSYAHRFPAVQMEGRWMVQCKDSRGCTRRSAIMPWSKALKLKARQHVRSATAHRTVRLRLV